ncbi:type II toxin-antitoxin system PemK/MazF family toxin [Companilactobacillus jidongensis]|uniref:type II toxin-antitoxin system PemK/MazF family toxin n=1 Tax=Companilactobacillus jidongensis TaxID=2486006 RepID=UPI000F7B0068|nr:type II toxin-antitoxin system PemK/MazF family toxin [Companilactobacillus jidongensis]
MSEILRPMDLYIANVPFDEVSKSKLRPALVVDVSENYVLVFKITSKYENKSTNIKKTYYPIQYWEEAGLMKKSYVDIHKNYKIIRSAVFSRPPIGRLKTTDINDLYLFVQKYKDSI